LQSNETKDSRNVGENTLYELSKLWNDRKVLAPYIWDSRTDNYSYNLQGIKTCSMKKDLSFDPMPSLQEQPWSSFEEILERLHQAGIYLHSEQLAAFLLMHGLPVDLCYVGDRLRPKAEHINRHYQGDMARLEELASPSPHFISAAWSLRSLPQPQESSCQ
jgi:hypothetical protein